MRKGSTVKFVDPAIAHAQSILNRTAPNRRGQVLTKMTSELRRIGGAEAANAFRKELSSVPTQTDER